jgi:membrane protein
MTWSFPRIRELFVKAATNWSSDNAPRLAAAFSFYAILSLAPILVLAIVAATTFFGHTLDAQKTLYAEANRAVGTKAANLIVDMIKEANKGSTSLIATLISLGVTFFSASNLFIQLRESVNAIWKMPQKGSLIRNLIKTRVMGFLGVLFFGSVVLVWLAIDSWLGWLEKHTYGFQGWQFVSFGLAVVLMTLMFAVSLHAMPHGRLKWSDVWPGAIVTAIGLGITKLLLSYYFANFDVSATFGSAGALVVILLWIYYTSQIYFFGVELTCTYAHEYGSLKGIDETGLEHS